MQRFIRKKIFNVSETKTFYLRILSQIEMMNNTVKILAENSTYGCCTTKEAFLKLVTHDPEAEKRFWDKVKWREDNNYWLNKTVKIAVKILHEIRVMKITKEDLASATNISIERMVEIVKGRADMTLSEIGKIEKVLNVKLND